jgi:hypothetical protein
MQLGDIFAGASKAGSGVFRAPTKSVKFKVVRDIDGELFVADARAVLRFVPEDAAEECKVAAEKELRKKFPDGAPVELLLNARAFHVLQRALRDVDDPRVPFASSVDELKGALQERVAVDVYNTYVEWVKEEFPEIVDDETFDELVEAASKKSLPDLFSLFDSSKIRRAWPSLVAHFGRSTPTQMSGGGEPG